MIRRNRYVEHLLRCPAPLGPRERGHAERCALLVGLWPPMLWLTGDTPERRG